MADNIKPRVRYRPGVGYFYVLKWFDGAHCLGAEHHPVVRTVLVGPYPDLDSAARGMAS